MCTNVLLSQVTKSYQHKASVAATHVLRRRLPLQRMPQGPSFLKCRLKLTPTLTRTLPCPVQEAHINGLACVIACSQETAEKYCEGLRSNGLISSLEPDSGA